MKKINVYFIGECIIIVLLLAIIGLLISDRGTISDGRIAREVSAEEQSDKKYEVVMEEGDEVSRLQKVADSLLGGTAFATEKDASAAEEERVAVTTEPEEEKVSSVLEGKKIVVFKYRPKKHSATKKGHRQSYTKLIVEAINAHHHTVFCFLILSILKCICTELLYHRGKPAFLHCL